MEVVTKAAHPDSICEGCLSRGRILTIITNNEIKVLYRKIISDTLHAPGKLILCWECIANMKRYVAFRHQCTQAHDTLAKYLLAPSKIKSLSRLTIAKNNVEINITHSHEESLNDRVNLTHKYEEINHYGVNLTQSHEEPNVNLTHTQNPSSFDNDFFQKTEECKYIGVNLTQSLQESHITDNLTHEELRKSEMDVPEVRKRGTDITFIKVEEDSELNDVETFYVDDECHHQDDLDDKKFTAVLKKETEKSKAKTKRRKKKLVQDDFNDSDEEPLNNKKRSKTVRERKHKRKKENGMSDGDVREPVPRTREKPAGVVNNPRVHKKLQQLNVGEGQLEMVVLSWEEVEEERQRALSSVVFTRHEYQCADCIVGFNHKFKLDNHMKKHDPSAGAVVCGVCRVRCRDAHALSAHRRRHRVRWRCCSCGVTSSRAAVAADHAAREHGAPAPTHSCGVCGHAEPTLGKLRNHIKNHAERQKCDLCGKTFRDRTSLRTHLFIHNGEKEYSCPRCEKKFLFKKAMEVHLVTHEASAHLYCYLCDMNFKNRMSYTQHMKYSLKHIDPAKLKYACKLCDKKFVKAKRLEEHNLAVHLKATPISCTMLGCNFACSSRPVLRTHVRMLHRNKRAQRNHVCDACGKAYTTKKTLEGHLRSHSGARPFQCAQCPALFGYEAALYNHNKLVHRKGKISRRPAPPAPPPAPPDHPQT